MPAISACARSLQFHNSPRYNFFVFRTIRAYQDLAGTQPVIPWNSIPKVERFAACGNLSTTVKEQYPDQMPEFVDV
jgi:hypothetical protein